MKKPPASPGVRRRERLPDNLVFGEPSRRVDEIFLGQSPVAACIFERPPFRPAVGILVHQPPSR